MDAKSFDTGERIFDLGILKSGTKMLGYCDANALNDDESVCMNHLMRDEMEAKIRQECHNKNQCTIQDPLSYYQEKATGNISCYRNSALLFIQGACLFPEEELAVR